MDHKVPEVKPPAYVSAVDRKAPKVTPTPSMPSSVSSVTPTPTPPQQHSDVRSILSGASWLGGSPMKAPPVGVHVVTTVATPAAAPLTATLAPAAFKSRILGMLDGHGRSDMCCTGNAVTAALHKQAGALSKLRHVPPGIDKAEMAHVTDLEMQPLRQFWQVAEQTEGAARERVQLLADAIAEVLLLHADFKADLRANADASLSRYEAAHKLARSSLQAQLHALLADIRAFVDGVTARAAAVPQLVPAVAAVARVLDAGSAQLSAEPLMFARALLTALTALLERAQTLTADVDAQLQGGSAEDVAAALEHAQRLAHKAARLVAKNAKTVATTEAAIDAHAADTDKTMALHDQLVRAQAQTLRLHEQQAAAMREVEVLSAKATSLALLPVLREVHGAGADARASTFQALLRDFIKAASAASFKYHVKSESVRVATERMEREHADAARASVVQLVTDAAEDLQGGQVTLATALHGLQTEWKTTRASAATTIQAMQRMLATNAVSNPEARQYMTHLAVSWAELQACNDALTAARMHCVQACVLAHANAIIPK